MFQQQLWDEIIRPQHFYPEEVYYTMTGELCPWFAGDSWNALPAEEKKRRMISDYGERPCDNANVNEMGYIIKDENGVIIAWCLWGWFSDKKYATLKFIVVNEKHQQKGLGGQLLKIFIDWCYANGKVKASLSFLQHRPDLKKFYKKYGFCNRSGFGESSWGRYTTWSRINKRPINKCNPITDYNLDELFSNSK